MNLLKSIISNKLRLLSGVLILVIFLSTVLITVARVKYRDLVEVIFYDATGDAIQSSTLDRGSELTFVPNLAKDGAVFVGWYSDKELTKPYDITLPVKENVSLYPGFVTVSSVGNYDGSTLFLKSCPKDISFYVNSELSETLIENGIVILDELTGEKIPFSAVSSGDGFVIRADSPLVSGHTYYMTLPDGIDLDGAESKVRNVGFSVAPDGETSLEYFGEITEIPELNPSADSSLHSYTNLDVRKGSLVLVGGSEKKLYLVSDSIATASGNCLLLSRPKIDSLLSVNLHGDFAISLKNGTLTETEPDSVLSANDAEKLYSTLKTIHEGELAVTDTAPKIITDADGLIVSVSTVENADLGKTCDLITVTYKSPVELYGEEGFVEMKLNMLVWAKLGIYISKDADGELFYDVSVSADTSSDLSVTLTDKNGKVLPYNEEDFISTENGKSAVEKVSEAVKDILSLDEKLLISEFDSVCFGDELRLSGKVSLFTDLDISASVLDLMSGQTVSEVVGVRGTLDKNEGYRRVSTSLGSLTGNIAGKMEGSSGLYAELGVSFARTGTEVLESSMSISHKTECLGAFSAEQNNGRTNVYGTAFVELSSEGFAMSGTSLETAVWGKADTLSVGSEYIIPSDSVFETDVYNVSTNEFDISNIVCEPLVALNLRGELVNIVPDIEDVKVHFSGEHSRYITYDPNTGIVSFVEEPFPENAELYADIYIASSTFDGSDSISLHRKVTLKFASAAPTEKVKAVFKLLGSVIAVREIPVGTAPGFARIDNELLMSFSERDFASLWDKDPYLPINADTEYNLTAKELSYPVAFVYYTDGHWNLAYRSVQQNSAFTAEIDGVKAWTAVYPSLMTSETGLASSLKLPEGLAYEGMIDAESSEGGAFDTMAEAIGSAWNSALGIYVADYSGECFTVEYMNGDEKTQIEYEKNMLRAGLQRLVFSHTPTAIYANTFSGWEQLSYTDTYASYSAHFVPARFTLTVLDANGNIASEETVTIGEIPAFLATPPTHEGKTGIWLSSNYSNFADWQNYPELAAISRDTVITPYFGEVFTVTVNLNGGKIENGTLYASMRFAPGEVDFDSLLPVVTKDSDVANSYIFNGWGTHTVSADTELVAEFTANAHVYTITLNAAGGLLDGAAVTEFSCTYPELQALLDRVLAESVPEKAPTETRSYKFSGWTQQTTDAPYTVSYIASYEESERLYKVTLTAPDGGLFPSGESEIVVYTTYKSTVSGLDSYEYMARIPSTGDKINVISSWKNGEESLPLGTTLTVTSDITLTAVYTERDNPKFTVTLNAGEGSFSNGKTTIVLEGYIGDPISRPSDPSMPSKTGYTSVFLGWDGEIPPVFTSDLTLNASYKTEKKAYTVTYYNSDSTIYVVYKVLYGEKIPIPEDPKNEGTSFLGWTGLPESGNIGDSDLKIYPKYDRNDFRIYYYVDGELYDTESLYFGDKIVRRFYPYKPGYVFSGWSYPSGTDTMPAKDIAVTGTFKKGTYEIVYMHNGEIYKETKATYGDTVKLIAAPEGSGGWKSTDVTISNGKFVMPYLPVVISTDSTGADFTIQYTVDGEVISTATHKFGDKVSHSAVPSDPRFTGNWLFRPAEGGGDVTVTDYMPNVNLIAVPEKKIINILSGDDINKNGVDDYIDLIETARAYVNSRPIYKDYYYSSTGYPTNWDGVCTDVIWRAYFGIGVAFKDLVDSDIAYCATLDDDKNPYEDAPNPVIDFRRVRNLLEYFKRNATVLTTETDDPTEWQPGDIVVFSPSHIGICSDKRDSEGIPYVIHHTYNRGAIESDELGEFNVGNYEVVGHFRINPNDLK